MRRRYIQIDGELVEVSQDYVPEPRGQGLLVIGDIQPYQSMVDGSIIGSRSHHNAHLRRHNLVEVGTEKIGGPRVLPKDGTRKEAMIRSLQVAKERYGSRAVELAISDAMNKAYELRNR